MLASGGIAECVDNQINCCEGIASHCGTAGDLPCNGSAVRAGNEHWGDAGIFAYGRGNCVAVRGGERYSWALLGARLCGPRTKKWGAGDCACSPLVCVASFRINAAGRLRPSGMHRLRVRTDGLLGSPIPPAIGHGACHQQQTL